MIQEQIISNLYSKGLTSIDPIFYNNILTWQYWYKGLVPSFHYYNVKLADGTTVQKEKLTMNYAKKVSEDMSKLLWSNKVQINLDSEEKTQALWEILDNNNFSQMISQQIEMCAMNGTVVFSEFLFQNNVIIDYVGDATKIIPYTYRNNIITGLVTISQFTRIENKKSIYYTHLTYHEYSDNSYTKYNELYRSKTQYDLGREVDFKTLFPDVQEVVVYENIEYPHFQVLRFPICNNYDFDNPMGVSIYANSIDRLKAIDTKYDSFNNEFISGRKRILVDASALKGVPQVGDSGNITTALYFDRNDTTYVALRGMDQQPIKDIDFNLRYQEHIDSIQSEVNWVSSNIGFGENFYNIGGNQPKTATEVISQDNDAYRTKQSYETAIIECLKCLIQAVCYLAGIQVRNIDIVMDYSRFKNDSAEQTRLMQEVNAGITSKVDYRVKVYNEDEEIAKAKIESIKSSDPTIEQLVGT